MSDADAIVARLSEFSALIAARDMAIVDALWSGPGFLMLGSEAGERAESHGDLVSLFRALFAKPYTLCFAWHGPEVTVQGDTAWVTTEAVMRVVLPDREIAMPYRMVGIFERRGAAWAWRLFSGSEPAPPPPPPPD